MASFDDSVDEVVAVDVTDKGYRAFLQVFVLPRSKGHLVSQMHHERIHAVALDCDGDSLAFGDQLADLFHHYGFVYGYSS